MALNQTPIRRQDAASRAYRKPHGLGDLLRRAALPGAMIAGIAWTIASLMGPAPAHRGRPRNAAAAGPAPPPSSDDAPIAATRPAAFAALQRRIAPEAPAKAAPKVRAPPSPPRTQSWPGGRSRSSAWSRRPRLTPDRCAYRLPDRLSCRRHAGGARRSRWRWPRRTVVAADTPGARGVGRGSSLRTRRRRTSRGRDPSPRRDHSPTSPPCRCRSRPQAERAKADPKPTLAAATKPIRPIRAGKSRRWTSADKPEKPEGDHARAWPSHARIFAGSRHAARVPPRPVRQAEGEHASPSTTSPPASSSCPTATGSKPIPASARWPTTRASCT